MTAYVTGAAGDEDRERHVGNLLSLRPRRETPPPGELGWGEGVLAFGQSMTKKALGLFWRSEASMLTRVMVSPLPGSMTALPSTLEMRSARSAGSTMSSPLTLRAIDRKSTRLNSSH